ncbi:MAG: hypothetical protein QOF02_1234 [Blastocatellia bacterium]|jgi:uncharacterized protein YxjI|nr:hypothetical protein [Blastocatellia bacterium]
MNYPLQLSFKLMAIAQQLSLRDTSGQLIFYVKQKAFKLKEAVTVFADAEQQQPLFYINANKILDFSANYQFTDRNGALLGSVRRQGMRSIWRASYDIYDERNNHVMSVKEEKPWSKVFDALLGEVPLVGMFTGFFFHPSYLVSATNGQPIMRLQKQRAFFEGKFTIEQLAQLPPVDETRTLLALIMMVLLERARG